MPSKPTSPTSETEQASNSSDGRSGSSLSLNATLDEQLDSLLGGSGDDEDQEDDGKHERPAGWALATLTPRNSVSDDLTQARAALVTQAAAARATSRALLMGGSVNRLVAGAEAELARQALEEADAALLRISRAHDRADDAQPDWLDEAEVALTHAASPGASSSAAALFSPPTVARDPPGELPPVEDGDASPPAPPIDANMSASFPDSDEGFERGLDAFERLLDAERRLSESEDEVRRTRRDSDAAAARHEAELSLIRREARRESDEAAAHAAAVSVAHNATHEAVLAEETWAHEATLAARERELVKQTKRFDAARRLAAEAMRERDDARDEARAAMQREGDAAAALARAEAKHAAASSASVRQHAALRAAAGAERVAFRALLQQRTSALEALEDRVASDACALATAVSRADAAEARVDEAVATGLARAAVLTALADAAASDAAASDAAAATATTRAAELELAARRPPSGIGPPWATGSTSAVVATPYDTPEPCTPAPSSSRRHMLSHTPFLSPCSGSADTPRPSWTPDEAASQCEGVGCISGQWNIFNRRHHCRSCGGLFCDRCTQARVTLAHLGYPLYEEQRVCEPCRKSVEEA